MRVQDAPFRLDRVIEKLATSDKVTLTAERQPEGKMRVTAASWADEKVFARGQVLEDLGRGSAVRGPKRETPRPLEPSARVR